MCFFSLSLFPLWLAHSLDFKIIFFWTQRVWQCLTKILPDPHLIAGTTPDFMHLYLDVPFVLQGGLQYPLHFAVLPPNIFLKASFLTQIVYVHTIDLLWSYVIFVTLSHFTKSSRYKKKVVTLCTHVCTSMKTLYIRGRLLWLYTSNVKKTLKLIKKYS